MVAAACETDEVDLDDDDVGAGADDAATEEPYEPDEPEVLEPEVQRVRVVSAASSQEREFSSSFQTV